MEKHRPSDELPNGRRESKGLFHDADYRSSSPALSSVDVEKGTAKLQQQLSQQGGLWHKFIIDSLCVLLNTVCTVLLVFANKVIFSDPQLKDCQVITAAWHFIATTIVLLIASSRTFQLFTAVRLRVLDILPISILFVGFLILGNLSLAMNPVAFYQIAKILTTPTVVAINFALFGKRISFELLMSVVVCCAGVMLTVSGVALSNSMGTIIAVLAFVTTAFYQIWIGKKIGDLNVSAPQLLMNQAPLSVVLLVFIAPFSDKIPDISKVDTKVLQLFFVSGILAAGLNLSQFLIIGRTSALTFNIVSNAKNIIIISLGWWQAGKVIGMVDLFGVSLALGGAFMYSWLCQKSK